MSHRHSLITLFQGVIWCFLSIIIHSLKLNQKLQGSNHRETIYVLNRTNICLPIQDAGYVTEVHHINGEGEDAGVVYCEMQARENSGESRSHLAMLRAMYPGHCGYKVGWFVCLSVCVWVCLSVCVLWDASKGKQWWEQVWFSHAQGYVPWPLLV